MNQSDSQHRGIQQAGAAGSTGQLTYSSFDTGTGAGGGWQIKQATDTLDPSDRELLRAWVSTSLIPVQPMPQFPTPEEVQARPHRLMYAPVSSERGAYWHTVPAGADGSGRPGNVFAHTFLDAAPPVAEHRPIDLWRSPDWLIPFGAREVLAAELPPHPPQPGAAVSRDAVIDFLLDPSVWRVSLFSVLLDAVAGAIDGGPAVVFGAERIDSAALWIGAVSHFLSKYAARKLAWSTFERATDLPTALSQGLHLIAVPLSDLAELESSDRFVVLAESDEPSRGEYRVQPNRTPAGAKIPVTRLSQIAEVLLIDPDVVRRVLRTRDSVVERVSDAQTDPSWSVAMAIELEDEEDLSDAEEDCAEVITGFLPSSLREYPDLHAAASAVVAKRTGTSPADALAALGRTRGSSGSEPSVSVAMTLQVYLERALADREWLVEAPPSRLAAPQPGWAPPELLALVDTRVGEMLRECETVEPDGHKAENLAVVVLRLTDLLVRTRVIGEDSAEIVGSLQRILEQAVPTVFFDDDRVQDFVGRVGHLDPLTCRLVLQPVIVSLDSMKDRPIGTRLNRGVIAWAVPYKVHPEPLAELLAGPVAEFDPERALYAERIVAEMRGNPDDRSNDSLRSLCLAHVLLTGELDPELQGILFRAPAWAARDLELVMRRFGDRLPPTAAWWTLLRAPSDRHLAAIMDLILPRDSQPDTHTAVDRAPQREPNGDMWRRLEVSPDRVPGGSSAGWQDGAEHVATTPVAPGGDRWGSRFQGRHEHVDGFGPQQHRYDARPQGADPHAAPHPGSTTAEWPGGLAARQTISEHQLMDALRQLVQLRRITTWQGVDKNTVLHGFHALTTELAVNRIDIDSLSADLQVNLAVLQMAKLIAEPSTTSSSSWKRAQAPAQIPLPGKLGRDSLKRVQRALLDLCGSGVVDMDEVVTTAFLVSPSGPGFTRATKCEQDLGSFAATEDEYPASLLDRIVESLVAEQHPVWPDGPDQMPQSVLKAIEERHRTDPEPPIVAYRKYLKRWLEARGVESGGTLKSLFRRRG
ncbi:hypothetical protein AB4Z09_18295 [Rhodococcus sp. TAF43]|uniref:GAP1-N2 domain-containing protein n=1 Tax=Rhodococcus sp. TAF43 TaxID=3237483 RepID=UPI003F98204D